MASNLSISVPEMKAARSPLRVNDFEIIERALVESQQKWTNCRDDCTDNEQHNGKAIPLI